MSGLTRPQTSLSSALSHSTLSGVGGLCCSPRWACIFMRTRSTSFSTFLPAFSAAIHATAETLPMSVLRQKNWNQPTCLPVAQDIQMTKQRAATRNAPVRRMLFAWATSMGSTGGGKDWRQILPGSAGAGAVYFASCVEAFGAWRRAVPALGFSGSRAALSRSLPR